MMDANHCIVLRGKALQGYKGLPHDHPPWQPQTGGILQQQVELAANVQGF